MTRTNDIVPLTSQEATLPVSYPLTAYPPNLQVVSDDSPTVFKQVATLTKVMC